MGEPRQRHGLRVRRERHRHLDKVCRRKADGTLWRPSYPNGYGEGDALASMLSRKKPNYYFSRVVRHYRWWWFDCWVETWEEWQPSDSEFQVLDEREAIPS